MNNKICLEIHKKYIIKLPNGEMYCKKCDWGYLDTLEE